MKPLFIILLFTIGITAIEWGLLEIVIKNELKQQEKTNPVDTRIPAYLQSSYVHQRAAIQNAARIQSVEVLMKKKAKASHHFDGRTSW